MTMSKSQYDYFSRSRSWRGNTISVVCVLSRDIKSPDLIEAFPCIDAGS
jgi:hypothetical protein